jgi:putative ABC transport system permease protein
LSRPNPEYTNWSTNNHSFDGIAAYDGGGQANLAGAGEPERIETAAVTANFLTVLGILPVRGRAFLPNEDRPDGAPVVLLTDSLWRRTFHADPGIVGKSIALDGRAYAIVSVLPASFHFPDKSRDPQCRFPFQLPPAVNWGTASMHLTRVIGRLAPGVSLDQAHADLTTLALQSNSAIPVPFAQMRDVLQGQVIPLHQKLVGDIRTSLLVLLIAVRLVLLIACVNVANLQLVRAAGRHKELAVRAAIGASHALLIQQLLIEGTALAAMGGVAGLILAAIGVRFLRISLPATITQIGTISVDRPVLLFALGVTCFTAVLFGLAPAFRASRPDVNDALKDGGSFVSESYAQHGLRSALVAAEFTLAFLLRQVALPLDPATRDLSMNRAAARFKKPVPNLSAAIGTGFTQFRTASTGSAPNLFHRTAVFSAPSHYIRTETKI